MDSMWTHRVNVGSPEWISKIELIDLWGLLVRPFDAIADSKLVPRTGSQCVPAFPSLRISAAVSGYFWAMTISFFCKHK